MGEQATRDREFGPLERIRDNHPKYNQRDSVTNFKE